MRTTAGLAVVAALAVAPATAAADEYADDADDFDLHHQIRPEGALGFLVGAFQVGWLGTTAAGAHLDAGARWCRFALLGEYDFLVLSEDAARPDPTHGLAHRIGANLRASPFAFAMFDHRMLGDLWVEAGAGRQIVRWYDGGRLARNDVSLGVGGQIAFRFGERRAKRVGIYYAMKVLIAPRAETKGSGCDGPCDAATDPMPYDLGVFFNLGIPFGG